MFQKNHHTDLKMNDKNPEVILKDAPMALSVQDFAEARAQELLAMARAAHTVSGKMLPIQKVPRHMRRRAASHNVKRLPRNLRKWATREIAKSGGQSISKKPSRKHRRRPKNLLQDYNRRKLKHVWLESHIWHAKRFHMTEKWGYKVPLHPNDKGCRAAYRASAKYCVMQDLSYYCCIELSGQESEILEALSHITSTEAGLTFAAKVYRSGTREGRTTIFRHKEYPFGALGPVRFMWRYQPNITTESDKKIDDVPRQLWIWAHPAMYADLMTELKVVLGVPVPEYNTANLNSFEHIKEEKTEPNLTIKEEKMGNKEKSTKKTDTVKDKNKQSEIIIKEKFTGNGVTATSHKDTLCRFHLTGPLSTNVLIDTLKIASVDDLGNAQSSEVHLSDVSSNWWQGIFDDSNGGQLHKDIHERQKQTWEHIREISSPAELKPSCILGLVVRDPRIFLPKKKAMVDYEKKVPSHHSTAVGDHCPEISWSPIWHNDVRCEVKVSKMPDHQMNAKRSEALVPGSDLDLGEQESRIPVLLIQTPGMQPSHDKVRPSRNNRTFCCPGFGSGWDLILPGGWGMSFLVGLVYRGARMAGLKELHSLSLEQGVFSYPNNHPDTPAGHEWELSIWKEKQAKYNRMPPAKRSNFVKLGQVAPFHFPWIELLTEWAELFSGEKQDNEQKCGRHIYVLRTKSQLKKLKEICQLKSKSRNTAEKSEIPQAKVRKCESLQSVHDDMIDVVIKSVSYFTQCLIPVKVDMVLRGNPVPFSTICIPTNEDFMKLLKDKHYGGPVEPLHKVLEEETNNKSAQPSKKDKSSKLSDLSAPPATKTVIKSSAREIVGYIQEGNFSFASGHGFGLGFIALTALNKLLEINVNQAENVLVLLRSPSSLQYRFAYLTVVVY